jgi:hypothetical protein
MCNSGDMGAAPGVLLPDERRSVLLWCLRQACETQSDTWPIFVTNMHHHSA